MKNFLLLAAAFLTSACVLLDRPVSPGRSRNETVGDPTHKSKNEPEESTDTSLHLYLSAVEYPKDYDWIKDTAHSTVDARLMLFRDGECIVSFPAGDAYHSSTDPDTHWILGGHLYTCFSDGHATYIQADGQPLHQFNGAEDIKGMILKDGVLWTLGQKRRGDGFVLRCNGEAVIDNAQGSLIGSLYEDEGEICFAYGYSIQNSGFTIRKYYLSASGRDKEVSIPAAATAVFDIRRVGGITWATYRQPDVSVYPVLSSDRQSQLIAREISGAQSVEWCEIIPVQEAVWIKAWYTMKDMLRRFVLWRGKGTVVMFTPYIVIHDFYVDEDGQAGAVGHDSRNDNTVLFLPPDGRSRQDLGRRYRLISPRCGMMIGGKLYAALSGVGEDVLCINESRKTISMNGPLTSIAYQ